MRVLTGVQLGKYRVCEQIGEGAMAHVYRAEELTPHLQRSVAMKVLLPEWCNNAEVVARFVNEAKALGRISHPGVVAVYDVMTLDDGRVCLIMEHLVGGTLKAWHHFLSGPSWAQARPLMLQLADTMAAAHAAKIIHRDLKPANIFVLEDAHAYRTKILDFGIAKLVEGAGQVQTATGTQFGTGSYMPPEQFRSTKHVDERSDIYSLGCVFFEMFTGRPPFVAANFTQVMMAHMGHPPPTVSAFVQGLPERLDDVLLAMLAKDPNARFQSMQAVSAALQTIPA